MSETSSLPASPPSAVPWWASTIIQIGMTFGVPVLILGWYLAQDAGWIPNPVHAELQEMKGIALRHEATTHTMMQTMQQDARKRQLRCVMRATNEAEKRACFPDAQP